MKETATVKAIANPITDLKEIYDVIVIGSGYGGAISASRMARAGQKVCLLERGKEILPGSYPDNLAKAAQQMQFNGNKRHEGSQTGLFDFNVHPGMSVLVGCGLGGTSLINANVSIKPEQRVFQDSAWPTELIKEFEDENSLLNKGYALAEEMLDAKPMPNHLNAKKVEGLATSARKMGKEFYRTSINVNFEIDGKNRFGVEQKPCNMCGDCCSGCNNYAKNTVLVNYLPDAKNHGAEIFCEVSVKHIAKTDGGYYVHFSLIGKGEKKFNAPTQFVKATNVIVSAGTLGTTQIMLRSKEKGLDVSDQLGLHFSGNGDVLGFGYNTNKEINGVGAGTHSIDPEDSAGPCITGVIDLRHQEKLNDGMIIEDAAIPGALSLTLPDAMSIFNHRIGVTDYKQSPADKVKHKLREAESKIRGAHHGAVQNTQTYLVMTHDDSKGVMTLKNDRLQLNYPGVGREPIFKEVEARLREATKALEGSFVRNPIWSEKLNNELITVHPLGGCAMANDASSGVVNHKGQVFSKNEVHEGLYISDGSVIPRSLGVNPLLTISAIAERTCALIAQDNGWEIDYSIKDIDENVGSTQAVGVEFTETMRGFFSPNHKSGDYEEAFEDGKTQGNSIQFTLTIQSNDVYDMVKNQNHVAGIVGTVQAPLLSARPLSVSDGVFNLFVDDPTNVVTKLMKYRMRLTSEEGEEYYFSGFKFVQHDNGKLDMWPDTSTLFTTIYKGVNDEGEIFGQGILHILPKDFAKQMTTMKAVNATNKLEGLKALAVFGAFFGKSVFEVYGRLLSKNDPYNPNAEPRQKRELRMDAPEVYGVKTGDGYNLMLTRYQGGTKGPVLLTHGFSGNRYTFSIDTIETNMAEYLYAHGYDVWLYDYRLSSLVEASQHQHTIDSVADYDYPAAIQKIKEVTQVEEIDVVAHCVGSITLFMALLKGMKGVRSAVSAQIASHFHPAPQVRWKAGLHIPSVLDALGIESLTAYTDTEADWQEKLYNRFVKMYAEPLSSYCHDPSCQRMAFMFGPLIEHSQLNDATHKATIEMFGEANVTSFEQLTLMIRHKKLLSATGEDIFMQHFDRLKIPISFIHGEKNQLFKPESTLDTYNELINTNGKSLYKRKVIEGYGHNDCMYGKNAVNDVYPFVLDHLEAVNN